MIRKKINSISGLRAVALIGVCAYHLFPGKFPGAYLGVVVFFVLAGFLMTVKLDGEREKYGYFSPVEIVLKRASRLYPPLAAFVFAVLLWSYFLQPAVFKGASESVKSIFLGYDNIAQIKKGLSYFDSHGSFRPFTHMWALSLEMQFYLVFPFVHYAVSKFSRKSNRFKLLFYTAISAVSIILMHSHFVPGGDLTRAYYGSDTRMFAFTIGIIFGTFHGKRKFHRNFLINWTEIICLIFIASSYFKFNADSEAVYIWGMPVFAIVCGLLTLCLYSDRGGVSKILSNPVLKYLGERSYSIYLWQYAVQVMFVEALSNAKVPAAARTVPQIVTVLILSEISYRIFEKAGRKKISWGRISLAAALIVLSFGIASRLSVKGEDISAKDAIQKEISRLEKEKNTGKDNEKNYLIVKTTRESKRQVRNLKGKTPPSDEKKPVSEKEEKFLKLYKKVEKFSSLYPSAAMSEEDLRKAQSVSATVIGDSVMLLAEGDLRKLVPNSYIDTKVSRQLTEGVKLLEERKNDAFLNDVVVISLGTNGDFSYDELKKIDSIRGDKPIVILTTVMPDSWEDSVNKKIRKYAEESKGVTLIDWYAIAKSDKDLFYDDRTHPKPDGAFLYAQLIAKAIVEASK